MGQTTTIPIDPRPQPCIARCGGEALVTGRFVLGHDERCKNAPRRRPEWLRRAQAGELKAKDLTGSVTL